MTRKARFKHLECVVFSPPFKVTKKSPIALNEVVLFLGDIPNVPGHCAVVKYNGEVVWLVHPQDFRKAKEDEL